MKIIRISSEEMKDRLNAPFNPPNFTDTFTREMFHLEWHKCRNRLKNLLEQFGQWNAYGEGDYFLDEIVVLSRGFGVEITNPSIVTKKLLRCLQEFLQDLDQNYEIDLAFNLDGKFYDILVSSDAVVTDYPDDVDK